jgi:peptidyl-prolyl cis-trans isomerase D
MAKSKGTSISRTAMWILMGLLILGLAGFGAINVGGNIRSIGTVGEKQIPVDTYARQLQNEIRAIEQQTGQSLPFAQVQSIGLDRAVLQRLVRNRALDNEASQIGLSVGDEALREEILAIPAFQGIDGSFDREAYRFALQQSGSSEGEFETTLREEAARTLLQGAILSGVQMPDTYVRVLVDYVGEQRSFIWTELTGADLTEPLPTPTEEELRAYYEGNTESFMLDRTKKITYALLTPDAMIDAVDVPEEELRAEYEARIDDYQQPERRLVERLVFADQEAADRAAAQLEVGGATFESLVEDRGLDLADVDMGDVTRQELGAAGEDVFAAEAGETLGPLPSTLGPALFRVNAVLPAQNTSFEEAAPALRQDLALTRAQRAVEARAQDLDDQLAGGATLEQLAEETEMELGTIDWTPESSEGIAAYPDFRQAAAALETGDFPRIEQLDDGSIFAMRLDELLPERVNPFEAARADVQAAWQAEQTVERLTARADELVSTLSADGSFAEAGLTAVKEDNLTRDAFVNGTPEAFMSEVFDMAPGEATVIPGEESVFVVKLESITPATEDADSAALLEQLGERIDQALAEDLFNVYAGQITSEARPQIDRQALQAVHVNFP